MYDYRGAIHLHSNYSDGHASVEQIMKAANDVGLDFVILTDHDTSAPHDDGHEKWHGSVMLITGMEITPRNNHYIAFGPGKLKDAEGLRAKVPQEYIDAVNEAGWAGFIAHPDHVGTERFNVQAYKWLDWNVDRFTGMGIWDLQTDWQSKLDRDDVTIDHYDNFVKYLSGPREETLKRWDELNLKRRVVGIGELDNHSKTRKFGDREINVFPYEVAFRTVTNHVLLDQQLDKDFKKAKAQILDAVKKGRLYVSFDWWADPTEFQFEIEEAGRVGLMGDEFELKEKAELVVALPEKAHLLIVRNGESVFDQEADEAILEVTEPGVYRAEAIRNGLAWIASNPIRVFKG